MVELIVALNNANIIRFNVENNRMGITVKCKVFVVGFCDGN